MKIVLVDDQPIFGALVRNMLAGRAELAAEAHGFDDALVEVARHQPTGVIIDVSLGSRNGFHLAAELRRRNPRIKIVLTSAFDERVYAELVRRIPGAIFVPKAALSGDGLVAHFTDA